MEVMFDDREPVDLRDALQEQRFYARADIDEIVKRPSIADLSQWTGLGTASVSVRLRNHSWTAGEIIAAAQGYFVNPVSVLVRMGVFTEWEVADALPDQPSVNLERLEFALETALREVQDVIKTQKKP